MTRNRPGPTLYVFTRRAVRRLDRLSVAKYRLPTLILMENAAAAAAGEALRMLPARGNRSTVIVCGPGNNGGDGLAMARHLSNAGIPVGVVTTAPARAYSGDAAVQLGVVKRMRLPLARASEHSPESTLARMARAVGGKAAPVMVVDAVFGTGLTRAVEGSMARLIDAINACGRRGSGVLAVDIPSGLDCDSGEPLGVAVWADVTVTFVGLKAGFLQPAAAPYLGEVVVADIGSPAALAARLGTPVHPPKRR